MTSDNKLDPITSFLVRNILRPKVYWQTGVSPDLLYSEPSIYVINHTGHLDGPFVTTALRGAHIHNLAAKDRFEQFGFGFFLRHSGCIPIDRHHPDATWIHDAVKVLARDKESIAIFPEGRHGTYRKQLQFQPGAALLAAASGVRLVMVYVDGPVKFFRKNGMLVSRPFRLDPPEGGVSSDYIMAQTAMLQDRMTALMEEYVDLSSKASR